MLKDGFPLIKECDKTKLRLTQHTRFKQIPPHPQTRNLNKVQHIDTSAVDEEPAVKSCIIKQNQTPATEKTSAANMEQSARGDTVSSETVAGWSMHCGSSVLAGCRALRGGEMVLMVHPHWNANPAAYQPAIWKSFSFLLRYTHHRTCSIYLLWTVCLTASNISIKPSTSVRKEIRPSLILVTKTWEKTRQAFQILSHNNVAYKEIQKSCASSFVVTVRGRPTYCIGVMVTQTFANIVHSIRFTAVLVFPELSEKFAGHTFRIYYEAVKQCCNESKWGPINGSSIITIL